MALSEKDFREDRISGSLSESRLRARTFACVSVSVLAHMSLLIGMILTPQAFKDIAGGNQKPEGSGVALLEGKDTIGATDSGLGAVEVAATEMAAAPQVATQAAPQAALTDSKSDVVIKELPRTEPLVAIKPVVAPKTAVAPVAKIPSATPKAATPKAATPKASTIPAPAEAAAPAVPAEAKTMANTMTDDNQDSAPVLLANPPADDNSSDAKEVVEQASAKQTTPSEPTAPETASETSPDAAPEKAQQLAVTNQPDTAKQQSESTPPAAIAQEPSRQQSAANEQSGSSTQARSESPAPIAGRGGSGGTDENSAGAGGTENTAGLGPAVGEPVRNASELKMLPGNPQPAYPQRERLARKQGTSVLIGKVSSDGRLVSTKVEHSSGSQLMDTASLQAFRTWRFQAGQEGWVRQPFQFKLVGEAREIPARLGEKIKNSTVQ